MGKSLVIYTIVLMFAVSCMHATSVFPRYDLPRKTFSCPSGTVVKKVESTRVPLSYFEYVMNIKLHCFEPSQIKTPSKILSIKSGSFYNSPTKSSSCPGVRGLYLEIHPNIDVYSYVDIICFQYPQNMIYGCHGPKGILTGIYVWQDGDTIRKIRPVCSVVGNIEEICTAADDWVGILSCDARLAVSSIECSFTKTVGTAYRKVLTESERTELNFYGEFKSEAGFTAFDFLKATFGLKLGFSHTTEHNWETSEDSTWSTEFKITVKAEILPGCLTIIEEVVGTCSFYSVRPNKVRRIDNCPNKTFITRMMLPVSKRSGHAFVLPIPKATNNREDGHRAGKLQYGSIGALETTGHDFGKEHKSDKIAFMGAHGYGIVPNFDERDNGYDESNLENLGHDSSNYIYNSH